MAEVHQEAVDEKNMVQGASVGKASEYTEDTLPPQMVPDDQVPSHELNMELKPLPPHLKYAYLADNQKLPVIIAKELTSQQEECLLNVLRRNKKAIGWSLANIVGIRPQVCEHCIFLEEGARPIRQPQKRLNPTILKVVKKEVTRLLEADIIYPISDNPYCSRESGENNFYMPLWNQGIVLGHVVSNMGISVDPAKVDVIAGLPYPFSKDVEFDLSEDCMEAFDKLKIAFSQAPIVRGPNWSRPFEIMRDASNYTVGAGL
ncbi:uncharacterized protein [Arachis hypogaea]|uniref:uncharacterized protein n=1 Tax=Arachis hypogaea TaxID=3818 RepID=UPI003B221976